MSFTLKLWLGATGLLCALGLLLVGCSQPAEPTDAGERVVADADRQSPIVSGAFEPAGKPNRKYIPPRELTAEELAEQRLTTIPNGVFVGYAEMMNPEEEIIELPTLYKARNIKPGPPPPLAIDLPGGEVTVLPELPEAVEPQPVRTRGEPATRTPGLEASFEGMYTANVAPSDSEVGGGPGNLISAVNTKYRLHTKAGGTTSTVSQTSLHGITCCCDARVVYDPDSQRYFVMSLVNSSTPRIALAMSKTSTPTNLLAGTSPDRDWLTWTITMPGTNRYPDFPQIGVDQNAIYLTGNMFTASSGSYLGVNLSVIPKADLLAGDTSPTVTTFTNLTESWSGLNYQAYTVVPSVAYGAPEVGILAEHYGQGMVTDDEGYPLNVNILTLWIVDDPAGSPTLSDYPVFVHRTGVSIPNAKQRGTTTRIATNGSELHGLTYRDGSLWACHAARKSSPNLVSCISWLEIDVAKALDPATAFFGWEQAGFVEDDERFYYFPKLTVDRYGNAGLVMCASHDAEYVSVWYATRASDDLPGSFDTPALMKAGVSSYVFIDNPSRWGDYCGINLDPSNERTFWASGQWAKSSSGWGTWIGSFTMPAQTAALPFFEDFEYGGGGTTPGLWSLVTGEVDAVGLAEPSAANSARLNGPDQGQDQFRTRQIDLSSPVQVEVSYWIQRGGGGEPPEAADLLSVDYVASDGNWANLQTLYGTGSAESAYAKHTHMLPPDAYHDHFRLRFSTATSFQGDDWFVDDVMIRDCGGTDSDGDGTYDDCDQCPYEPALVEPSEPGTEVTCDDAVDNDCDGLTDGADDDCGLPCTCGDIDRSGGPVDLSDFGIFALCYQLSSPDPNCDATELACSDLDGSGVVDLSDFGIFALVYGQISTTSPPNCP